MKVPHPCPDALPRSDAFPGSHFHPRATAATARPVGSKLPPVIIDRPCQLKKKCTYTHIKPI